MTYYIVAEGPTRTETVAICHNLTAARTMAATVRHLAQFIGRKVFIENANGTVVR